MNKSIADFIKPTIITAQQYGTKVSVELNHSDTDIDELMDAFHTLIVGLGYHDSAWEQWIVDRADEYKEEAAEEAMYEPSPELRRAAEEYVNMLSEKDIDEAISEHNAHEDESEFDDYGSRKPKKKTKKK
jgi:ribosomal protein L12E/L44/L45/RPP1/RPP2